MSLLLITSSSLKFQSFLTPLVNQSMDIQPFFFPILSSLPFFLLLFCKFIKLNTHDYIRDDIKPYPIIGLLPQFLKNRHRILDWLTETLAKSPTNTFHSFRQPGNVNTIVTANPQNVEYMLKTNFENFPKGPRFHSIFHDFLGNGIFNADGDLWKLQRKTASFEFNTRSLRNFVLEIVQEEIHSRLLPVLKNHLEKGEIFDLQDLLEKFAFDNICKLAFNEDPALLSLSKTSQLSSSFTAAFIKAAEISAGRFRYAIPVFWKLKRTLRIGSEKELKESISVVHDYAMQIIHARKKEMHTSSNEHNKKDEDLLSRFIALENHSEEFLRDIIVSFILAGRETTSSSLTWFFWLVSSRPDVQNKILDEISSIKSKSKGNSSNLFEFEELREMQYLHAAITESLRLYPPVPANVSQCMMDDVLPDGTEVKKGWYMSYNSYAMGRMESVWGKDCLEYRPERWLDENGMFKGESPFKFLAFHGGPRVCLGKEMAYIQMKFIVLSVLRRFEVHVVREDSSHPEHMLSITLRMRGGLPVRVRRRGKADNLK